MDKRSISGVAAATAGDFRYAFGQRADRQAWIRPLEFFHTDRGAHLFKMVFIPRRGWARFTCDPSTHAISCLVSSRKGSGAQVEIGEPRRVRLGGGPRWRALRTDS